MNKGDALLIELDYTVNGEALQEGEWDDIEFSLNSKSYSLSNGDIYWDGEAYVCYLSEADTFDLRFTNIYQLRLAKDGYVISSPITTWRVGGVLSKKYLTGDIPTPRYNALIDGSIKSIKSDVSTIRPYAFAWCEELESAEFTEATDVGAYAFWDCRKLKTVVLEKCNIIHEYAFKKNHASVLESVDAPNVTALYGNAFEGSAIKEIELPNLDSIGGECFKNSSIEVAMFPKLRQWLGINDFQGCAQLKVVDLGLTDIIENDAFEDCTSLNTMILRCPQVVEISARTTMFDGSPFGADGTGGTIYVPNDLLETYTSDRSTRTTWQYIKGLNANNQILPIEGSIYE